MSTTFDDLGYTETLELARTWLRYDDDEKALIAAKLGVTTEYAARMLRMWRQVDAKQQAEANRMVASLTGEQQEPRPAVLELTPPVIKQTQPINPHALLKAAVFDIECTDFGTEGYSGLLICTSILPLDGSDNVQTVALRYDDHNDDRRVLKETIAVLAQYDILIGHNVAAFDFNWLHSRWLFHDSRGSDVGDWPRWLYGDTFQMAKALAIKTRKGLGNLIDYFDIEGVKTTIYRTSWNKIRSYDQAEFTQGLHDIVYHCEQDVIANRNLWDILYRDSLGMRNNPLKVSKLAYTPGCVTRAKLQPTPPAMEPKTLVDMVHEQQVAA